MKTALNRYPISTIAGLCICLSATASATHLSHLGVFAPTFPVSTIRSRELLTAAYWFTASTSFANPAVTIARSLSDTFAGIRPSDVAPFIGAQLAGAVAATFLFRWLVPHPAAYADQVLVPYRR